MLAFVALLALGGVVAWLGHANRDLRGELEELHSSNVGPQVGQWLPLAGVTSYDGSRHVTLGAPSRARGQILYFYLPDCPYCRASEPYVSQLSIASRDHPEDAEFLPVSLLRSTPESPANLPGHALVMTDERMLKVFGISKVPTLLLVNSQGRVEYVHVGVIAKDDITKLWAALQPRKGGKAPSLRSAQ